MTTVLLTIGTVAAICYFAWMAYQVNDIAQRFDDIEDNADERFAELTQDITQLHATTHRALLASPDERDDLRREYQAMFPPKCEDEGS